ncbi:MAG: hypothetical protein OXG27_06290 [Chloroflexi bacterium]|nr:hypothetical protein [Chloroflexota bacterium]
MDVRGALAVLGLTLVALLGVLATRPAAANDEADITLEAACSRVTDSGRALCRLSAQQPFQVGDTVRITAITPDDEQYAISIEYDGGHNFRARNACDDCYFFSLQVRQQPSADGDANHQPSIGASSDQSAVNQSTDPLPEAGRATQDAPQTTQLQTLAQQSGPPEERTASTCVQNEQLPANPTCVHRPADSSVVTITPTATNINVAAAGAFTVHSGAQEQIPSGVDVQFHDPDPELVNEVKDEDGPIVVNAPTKFDGDGSRNYDAETNQARIEQALHEAGSPYVVCFPAETITLYKERSGEPVRTVHYPEEQVTVSPYARGKGTAGAIGAEGGDGARAVPRCARDVCILSRSSPGGDAEL